ncbi:hypothetical protein NLU13_7465 [Sarocladium strictum]|uniref:Zn(2)-C6 fungal-type domain-containing protein n=1 Tax=Sarocladium strictum TaxID=5046 RepID=A0AA39GF78_SARSR|nr:hypothetical protein NLU13_7465 [Sarocladium strictum]
MPESTKSQSRQHSKRSSITHTACQNCREKRAKCDGNTPCRRCETRQLSCHYAPRSWASKRSLRETADHYGEKLRQRDRVLDAVTSPVIGDHVLEYLKEHGVDQTYEKLETLGSNCGSDAAAPTKDFVSSWAGSSATDSPSGLEDRTRCFTADCTGAINCECMACWPPTSAMDGRSSSSINISPESQSTLSSNSRSTLPDQVLPGCAPLVDPSQVPIFPDGAGLGMFDTSDMQPHCTMPFGVIDPSLYPTSYDSMSWPQQIHHPVQGSIASDLLNDVVDFDKMANQGHDIK